MRQLYFPFLNQQITLFFKITDEDIRAANQEYQSLSDLILWSLPEVLLQPLLVRLRLDINDSVSHRTAKKWLLSADEALRNVVTKEALQWKKGVTTQVRHCEI